MSLKNIGKSSRDDDIQSLLDGVSSRRKRRRGWGWKIAGPVMIICAVVAVLVAVDYGLNSGKVYWGVEVGTVPLGGKTPAEAQEAVEERTTGALQRFEFNGPENFEFTAEEMGVDFDVAATVDEAYSVGRSGSILGRLSERLRGVYSTVQIEPEVDYQPEVAKAKVESLASRLDEQPKEAGLEIVGSEAQVTSSAEGYEVDVAATTENVNRSVEDMSGDVEIAGKVLEPEITTKETEKAAEKASKATSGQVVLKGEGQQWVLSPADVGSALKVKQSQGELQVDVSRKQLKDRMSGVYDTLDVKAKEASYDVSGSQISVVPSQTGKSIENEKLLGNIETGIFEGQREYQVPVVTTEPELTTGEAKAQMPTDLLGSYRTDYSIVPDPGKDRKENLQIASKEVNGTLVAPGEIFSMNAQVAGLDYNTTKVIVDGEEVKAGGGGLCQVTSTLYMAANFAGLNVLERTAHQAQLPYIRPGMDATVWFGDEYGNGELDMKFENTTDGYLLLQQYVAEDGYIYADIYGKPNGTEVSMNSKPLHKGADYSKWVTYKTVEKNGEVIYDGELHTDVYYPLVDDKGKTIKPKNVYVPPANP